MFGVRSIFAITLNTTNTLVPTKFFWLKLNWRIYVWLCCIGYWINQLTYTIKSNILIQDLSINRTSTLTRFVNHPSVSRLYIYCGARTEGCSIFSTSSSSSKPLPKSLEWISNFILDKSCVLHIQKFPTIAQWKVTTVYYIKIQTKNTSRISFRGLFSTGTFISFIAFILIVVGIRLWIWRLLVIQSFLACVICCDVVIRGWAI